MRDIGRKLFDDDYGQWRIMFHSSRAYRSGDAYVINGFRFPETLVAKQAR